MDERAPGERHGSLDERCLYTLMHAPREAHDDLLHGLVVPVVAGLRDRPELDSLFFVRYDRPEWQLRFRVLGRPDWVDGPVRRAVEERLPGLRDRGLLTGWEFGAYQREWERYGGPVGMRLCEQLFLHDSLACLDLLVADARGELGRSRREYSLAFTERFLDLLGLDRAQRIAFCRLGYQWAIDGGDWTEEDLGVLSRRYEGLREGLAALLGGEASDADRLGGPVPAAIAARCLAASRPAAEALAAGLATGRVQQEIVPLAWSLCHMHCNRLGLDVTAEAILRYFGQRLHEDGLAAVV